MEGGCGYKVIFICCFPAWVSAEYLMFRKSPASPTGPAGGVFIPILRRSGTAGGHGSEGVHGN